MLSGLLLEYTGTLLICAAILWTHANPIVVGLAYTSALFIANGASEGFFSPLAVVTQYLLGRLAWKESLKLVGAQVAAAVSVTLLAKKI